MRFCSYKINTLKFQCFIIVSEILSLAGSFAVALQHYGQRHKVFQGIGPCHWGVKILLATMARYGSL